MRVFVAVVDDGSFSAAAHRLDMSRAMVTRYIGALEQWLGARLLQRTTRRISLTDAGEQCLRRSQQMLALMEDMEQETCGDDGTLTGQLRITCSISFAQAQIAAAAVDFLKLHPALKINVHADEGAMNLVAARIDLAIRISAEPDPALIGRVLAPCASVLVAAPPIWPVAVRRRPPLTWPNTAVLPMLITAGASGRSIGAANKPGWRSVAISVPTMPVRSCAPRLRAGGSRCNRLIWSIRIWQTAACSMFWPIGNLRKCRSTRCIHRANICRRRSARFWIF